MFMATCVHTIQQIFNLDSDSDIFHMIHVRRKIVILVSDIFVICRKLFWRVVYRSITVRAYSLKNILVYLDINVARIHRIMKRRCSPKIGERIQLKLQMI